MAENAVARRGASIALACRVLAIFFLLWRPEGLFGEKIIRRV